MQDPKLTLGKSPKDHTEQASEILDTVLKSQKQPSLLFPTIPPTTLVSRNTAFALPEPSSWWGESSSLTSILQPTHFLWNSHKHFVFWVCPDNPDDCKDIWDILDAPDPGSSNRDSDWGWRPSVWTREAPYDSRDISLMLLASVSEWAYDVENISGEAESLERFNSPRQDHGNGSLLPHHLSYLDY